MPRPERPLPTPERAPPSGCRGTGRDGDPCRATPRAGRSWCANHDPDPEHRARMAEARAEGGRRSHGAPARRPPHDGEERDHDEHAPEPDPAWFRLETAADVIAGYGWTIRKLARGAIEPREANALFLGLSGLVRAIEGGDLEKRLEDLERALDPGGKR